MRIRYVREEEINVILFASELLVCVCRTMNDLIAPGLSVIFDNQPVSVSLGIISMGAWR